LTDNLSFDINSPNKDTIEEFVKELLFIFAKVDEQNEKVIIESFQQNTPELRQKIREFTDKFKGQIPSLNKVPAYFRKLQNEEHFFFLPNVKLEPFDNIKLYDYLKAAAEGKNFEELHRQSKELFEELFKTYSIKIYGDKRINIGEPKKSKRICRFCNNTKKPLTFGSTAHAISEALGNKMVRLFDECDGCNGEFSKTIELDIIQYLAIFRTFYNVKGKGGSKQFKGENFDLKNEETVELKLYSDNDKPDFSMPYKVTLETKEPISFHNIYKCLCKYFISVVDSQYLGHFAKTIDWISGKIPIKKLPRIGEMLSYHGFTKQPKLVTYIRRGSDKQLPFAVGEFYFTCKIFVFIIPLTDKDARDFTDIKDFDKYWDTFQHYKKSKGWALNDYSNDNKRKFIMNLNFEKNESTNAQQPV